MTADGSAAGCRTPGRGEGRLEPPTARRGEERAGREAVFGLDGVGGERAVSGA